MGGLRNERGVALLIVLLVTALLMALIFEFAYGTRVSLRAAANFRDSERAALLAHSGIAIFAKYQELQDLVPQGEWGVVPVVSQGDTDVRIRWEDEGGKIRIGPGGVDTVRQEWFRQLLTEQGVSQEVADRMFGSPPVRVALLSELHQVTSDEEYARIERYVTVSSAGTINVNTAPPEVLKSIGISASSASLIIERRGREPFKDKSLLSPTYGISTTVLGYLDVTSSVLRVQCHATVGGYTKQAEAVVERGSGGFVMKYWRML